MPVHIALGIARSTRVGNVAGLTPSVRGYDARLGEANALHVPNGWMWGGSWVAGGLLWVAGGWVGGTWVVRGWLVGGWTAPNPLQ